MLHKELTDGDKYIWGSEKDLVGQIYKLVTIWGLLQPFMCIFLLPVHNHHIKIRNGEKS